MKKAEDQGAPESRESIGIGGLDEVLGGGLPRPSVIALIGAPGCGTTSLCKHFIISSLLAGRRVLLVCSDEPIDHYMRNFDSVKSFDIGHYADEKKFFTFDLYQALTQSLGIRDYANFQIREGSLLDSVLPLANKYIRNLAGPPFTGFNVVLDSITSVAPFIGIREIYKTILEAQKIARENNHVLLFTGHDGALEGNFVQALRTYVDGVMRMRMHWVRGKLRRELIIEKMGFTEIKQPVLEFTVGNMGVELT